MKKIVTLPKTTPVRHPGFALVVTLALMVLLTVILVGLLSLSAVSLRTSGAGEAMATARANARMALMLALVGVVAFRRGWLPGSHVSTT